MRSVRSSVVWSDGHSLSTRQGCWEGEPEVAEGGHSSVVGVRVDTTNKQFCTVADHDDDDSNYNLFTITELDTHPHIHPHLHMPHSRGNQQAQCN